MQHILTREIICTLKIHKGNEFIFIKAQYIIPINVAIRKVEGVKWSQTHKQWYIPKKKEAIKQLIENCNNICTVNIDALKVAKKSIPTLNENIKINTTPLLQKTTDPIVPKSTSIPLDLIAEKNNAIHQFKQLLILKSYSVNTQRTYINEFNLFLRTVTKKSLANINNDDLKAYFAYCYTNLKLSENTIHSRLNAVKFYFERVQKGEKFFWEIPRPKKQLQLPKVLAEKELKRLFAAASNLKHKAILFVAYSAGLRVSEIINLRLQDIDREREQLFIHCSKGKKDRYVRLSPMVLDILEQYYKLSKIKPTNYLFESLEKGQPYSIRSAQQIFSDCKRKAGIIKSVSFHSLRHSFATHILEKGVDVAFIQEILGHFDIKTTLRYLHVRRDILVTIESPIESLYKR